MTDIIYVEYVCDGCKHPCRLSVCYDAQLDMPRPETPKRCAIGNLQSHWIEEQQYD